MAYEVQNFEDGQKLTAEQLNHMEAGIYANRASVAYTKQNFVNGKKLTAEQLNHMEDGIYAISVNSGSSGSGSGTGTLPTLTNPGAATDLAEGKQLIGADGTVVTGKLSAVSNIQVTKDNTSVQHSGTLIYVTGKRSTRAILDAGATLRMDIYADKFGDAKQSQVLEGTTFTSSNGLCLTGTMKASGGSSGGSTTAGVASFTLGSDASTAGTFVKLGNVPWIAEHINDENLYVSLIRLNTTATNNNSIFNVVSSNTPYANGSYSIGIYKTTYMTSSTNGSVPFNNTTDTNSIRLCGDSNGDVYIAAYSSYFFAAGNYALLYGLI
jgi:hypothetical protein